MLDKIQYDGLGKDIIDKLDELFEAFAKGAVYRGGWNPQVTPTYPDFANTNSHWDVYLNEGTTEFEWNDITWFAGDKLIYSKPDNKYFHIGHVSGVSSVNGQTGAVNLTANHVNAYTKAEVDALFSALSTIDFGEF